MYILWIAVMRENGLHTVMRENCLHTRTDECTWSSTHEFHDQEVTGEAGE